jgi:chaperonin GroEL
MLLRRNLEKGLRIILNELDKMSNPVEGREALTQVAESICYDEPLAQLLGEIFDIVGEYGHIEVRSARGRENEREYVEGMYWKSKIVSREFLTDTARYRTELEDAAILISDVQVGDPRELVPAIAATHKAGLNALLILAKSLSEEATNFLLTTNRKHEDFQVVATKIPGYTSSQQIDAMQDLAILTGGKPFASMGGEKIDRLRFDDLGRAKRAWIDRFNMGIIAGQGDPRAIRQHLANLRSAFRTTNDAEVRKTLQERIGKIMGGSATLWVGGASETDIDQKKELAKRTAEAMRGAVHEGVVPGAGVALLECRPALRNAMEEAEGLEERAAYRILIRALEEPARTIMANAGYNVEEVMAQLKLAGLGHGFDVRKGELVDIREAGLVDVTTVQKEAVRGGVESAALALTVDVLIHRKEPPESVSP